MSSYSTSDHHQKKLHVLPLLTMLWTSPLLTSITRTLTIRSSPSRAATAAKVPHRPSFLPPLQAPSSECAAYRRQTQSHVYRKPSSCLPNRQPQNTSITTNVASELVGTMDETTAAMDASPSAFVCDGHHHHHRRTMLLAVLCPRWLPSPGSASPLLRFFFSVRRSRSSLAVPVAS